MTRSWPKSSMRWLWTLGLSAISQVSLAHAPPEIFRIVHKSERELLLVTNRGLMFGELGPAKFRLMCSEALQINTGEQPQVAYRKDLGLLAATSNGLFITHDEGCHWAPLPPLVDMFVPALAQHPKDPDSLFAATFGPGQSAIRGSHDGGATWTTLEPLADQDYTYALLVAPSDAALLYASGTTFVETDAGTPLQSHYTARSHDSGMTWERSDVALEEGELNLTLLAVNPVRSEELLARASSASPGFTPERLLISQDGGRTFAAPRSFPSIMGAAFSPDGERVWIVGTDGMWTAGPTRSDFVSVGSAQYLTSVGYHNGALWTSGHYDGSDLLVDGIGQSPDPQTSAFASLMQFSDVAAQIACDSPDFGRACALPWKDFSGEVFRSDGADAGAPSDAGGVAGAAREAGVQPSATPDAGSSTVPDAQAAAAPAEAAGAGASGCALAAPSALRAPLFLLGLLGACLGLRRKRRRP